MIPAIKSTRCLTPAMAAAFLMAACAGDIGPRRGSGGSGGSGSGGSGGNGVGGAGGSGWGGSSGSGGSSMAGGSGGGGSGGSAGSGGMPPSSTDVPPEAVGKMGARRLTKHEYRNTVEDILDFVVPESALGLLPEDDLTPFDNDYGSQTPSQGLIEGSEEVARQISAAVLADTARRNAAVGCTPTGATDAGCLRTFVTNMGRRALRRPLTPEEVTRFTGTPDVGPLSVAKVENDFYAAVDVVLRALLQDPQFLYRVEIGTPVSGKPGMARLTPFEVASRLSYLFLGSAPDDALLDRAGNGMLAKPEDVRAAAGALLGNPRAELQIRRFHSLWLGYETLPHPAQLTVALGAETAALVERVVLREKRSWLDLFRLKETYISDYLADHYGLPKPGQAQPTWVTYAAGSGRQGILSHGSVLSNGMKFEDTSPTQRGLYILNRLLCTDAPPPPMGVDVDTKPTHPTSRCKTAEFEAHSKMGSTCHGCHASIDPIGWGLEQFDGAGRYRTEQLGAPECKIDGQGDLPGYGTFQGPGQLAELLASSDVLDACAATHVYRFTMGRHEAPNETPYLEALTRGFRSGNHRFDQLLVDLVAKEAFLHRVEE